MGKLHRLLNEAFEHNRPSNKVTFPASIRRQLQKTLHQTLHNQRFRSRIKSIIQRCFSFRKNIRVFYNRIFTSRFVFIYQQNEKILETEYQYYYCVSRSIKQFHSKYLDTLRVLRTFATAAPQSVSNYFSYHAILAQ